ncbi:MAG: cation transporter dimerization domain-containing protein [Streptococcus salivarius]
MISSWKQPLVCQTVSTRETSRPIEKAILEIPKVTKVKKQRGRSYGSNVYLDIVVEMNPDLSFTRVMPLLNKSRGLSKRFSVYDTDVHVEPAAIPKMKFMAMSFTNSLAMKRLFCRKFLTMKISWHLTST